MVSQASRLNRLPAAERGITIGDFLVPITIGERMSSRVRHVALIVAGALVIALSANLSIKVPGSPVPITGQTFSVLLVGGALGARRGVLATLLYLVLGPVPAGLRRSRVRDRRSSARSATVTSSSGRPAAT